MKRKRKRVGGALSIFWSAGWGFLLEVAIIGGSYLEKKLSIGLPGGSVLESGWLDLLEFGLVIGAGVVVGRKLEERKVKGKDPGFSQNQKSLNKHGPGQSEVLSGGEGRRKGWLCLLKAGEVTLLLGGAMILIGGVWFLILKAFGLFAFDEKIGLSPVYFIFLLGLLVAVFVLRRGRG